MFRLLIFAALLLVGVTVMPVIADPVSLMIGTPDDRHATFVFAEDRSAPEALVIETRRTGSPGAALRIWIDNSRTPLFDRILGADDCRFDDAGAVCRIAIAGDSPDYGNFVTAFRRGRTLHVEVQNASVMEMQEALSLKGFSAAYGR